MTAEITAQAPLTLLYVEDEQVTRDAVASLIRRRFPEVAVHTAINGAEGLERFRALLPDLVVTDIKMPVMHGIEMSRQIKALRAATPIIVTSAHGDMEFFIDSIEIGISRYVMKPIDVEKLFTTLEDAWSKIALERELKAQQEAVVALNRHLAAHAEELERANRDLESFGYTVSHDLRTPLTNINGYCQVILEIFGAGLDPKCREFIEVIYDETIAMSELIKTLLDFSRLTRTELVRKSVNLSELAQAGAAALKMREPQRQVEFHIEPGLAAQCDENLARVALDNLLGNAWKYSAGTEKARIEFAAATVSGEQVFLVRDNGAGFDMEQADQIFTPFKRLHAPGEFQGYGIGLATVQRIIERHGGRVWATGAKGEGAAFYFTLPAADKEPAGSREGAAERETEN